MDKIRGLSFAVAAIVPTLFIILWGLEILPTPVRFCKIAGIALFFFGELKIEKIFQLLSKFNRVVYYVP